MCASRNIKATICDSESRMFEPLNKGGSLLYNPDSEKVLILLKNKQTNKKTAGNDLQILF